MNRVRENIETKEKKVEQMTEPAFKKDETFPIEGGGRILVKCVSDHMDEAHRETVYFVEMRTDELYIYDLVPESQMYILKRSGEHGQP